MGLLSSRGSTRAWRQLRELILVRDDGLCQVPLADGRTCLQPASHVDHVLPRSRGGDDSPANLRAACRDCNLRRGADQLELVREWGWS